MNENPVFERIKSEIDESPVTLFMKGTPMFPQCGFSSAVVQALTMMGVKFKGVDVLADAEAALIGLGFKPQDAARALAQIGDPDADVESLIKLALKLLA